MTNVSDSDPEDKAKSPVNKLLQLPVSRIKTIMKSSPELGNVSPESYFLITRATELFVKYLAKKAYESTNNIRIVEYKALSKLVSSDECLDFLEEIVPAKIKMSDYWAKFGHPVEIDEKETEELNSKNHHSLKSPKAASSVGKNTPGKDRAPKTPEVICID